MENVIYDSNNDLSIGFYEDLVRGYKDIIKDFLDKEDYENAKSCTNELDDITKWKDYTGLLVLSENNGMGFTCKPYEQPKKEEEEDKPMKEFELTLLMNAGCDVHVEVDEIEKFIVSVGGRVKERRDDGVKTLAYEINGNKRANYYYLTVELPEGTPAKISSKLNLNDKALRYLLIRKDPRS